MSDNDLVMGMFPKPPSPKSPDWALGKLHTKIADFDVWWHRFKQENPGEEWVTFDLKISKQGKGYCVVDHWKPEQSPPATKSEDTVGQPVDDDVPF